MNWAISDREIATPVGRTGVAEMASLLVGRRGRPNASCAQPGRLAATKNCAQNRLGLSGEGRKDRRVCSTSFPGPHGAPSWISENQVDGDDLAKFLDTLNQPHPVEA